MLRRLCDQPSHAIAAQPASSDADLSLHVHGREEHARGAEAGHTSGPQGPSYLLRDISQVENLLFDRYGITKLCDFGSATTHTAQPTEDWNMAKRTAMEEEAARHTTPMYRAPEILDTYQNFPVGVQQDIWVRTIVSLSLKALGCILFYLCYRTHPFEDSAKLRILNAKYAIPANQPDYEPFNQVIGSCFLDVQLFLRKMPSN